MLILTQTTDSLQVVLSASATIEAQCFVSYRNTTSSAITPLRTVTNTNDTTAVTLVPAPSASNQRIVDYISIYNANSSSITPTVLFNDNGTTYPLFSATILPGEKIEYHEGAGFSVIGFNGGAKSTTQYGISNVTTPWTTVVLTSDVINNNATGNTYEDITGLSFTASTTGTYWVRLMALTSVVVNNRLGAYAFNGPTASLITLAGYVMNSNVSILQNVINAYNSPATALSTSSPASSRNVYTLEGFLTLTATGTVQARHSCSTSSGALTTMAGTTLQYYKVF
jgi:hypothetical protein